ncbi:MAG: GIY-YIG nuclease family protein [Candidatus Peregrinibacteria bacterium]|nr:GIY-YIG nuclease family protein [Candidatus Peregrinibacteria bacterium]
MAFVYMLWSEKDNGWYIGKTKRLFYERFLEHTAGKVRSTKFRRPLLLAYIEEILDGNEQKREHFLKHPSGYTQKLRITELLIMRKSEWPIRGPV